MAGSQDHNSREDLELPMWPWLHIGPYMSLVLCLCVLVSYPSKGIIILHRSPTGFFQLFREAEKYVKQVKVGDSPANTINS